MITTIIVILSLVAVGLVLIASVMVSGYVDGLSERENEEQ